jgi:hypothetical protein
MMGRPSGLTTALTAAMADRQGSPARAEGNGPVSGTQMTVSAGLLDGVSVGVLVGRLTDEAGDEAVGDDTADGTGPIDGEGAGPQEASRAQNRAIVNLFIVAWTVRSPDWLCNRTSLTAAEWPVIDRPIAEGGPERGRDLAPKGLRTCLACSEVRQLERTSQPRPVDGRRRAVL